MIARWPVWSVASLAAAIALPPHAAADRFVPVALDVQLLRADMIAFVTVGALTPAADDAAAVDVTVNDVSVLSSRWPNLTLRRFRVAGVMESAAPAGAARVRVPHRDGLTEGRRYLVFLHGGPWTLAPYPFYGLYPVNDDGYVGCAGGEVFGVASWGLLCSLRHDQVSPPLGEEELSLMVLTSLSNARGRRPDLARERDREVLPLDLTRDETPPPGAP